MADLITGRWTYRSYRNDPALWSGDASKALKNIFGEGVFDLTQQAGDGVSGGFDMGGGYGLDLSGSLAQSGPSPELVLRGQGREGTPTETWEYDYHAVRAYIWPNGVDQVAAFVGSVIRAKPHDGGAAGYVASFILIRQA